MMNSLHKYTNIGTIIAGLICAMVILVIMLHDGINLNQNQALQFYSLIATVSITILGFYITAVSILMFAFTQAANEPGNPLNIIKSAKSYPQLYNYFMIAIYSFSLAFLFSLIFYILNLIHNLSIIMGQITIAILSIFLFWSILYGIITIYLLSLVVNNFVKKIK